jgi:hypothetical protein
MARELGYKQYIIIIIIAAIERWMTAKPRQ